MPTTFIANIKGGQGIQGPIGLPGVNAVANDTATGAYITTPGSATEAALTARSSLFYPTDYGALGDGTTDDTAAIQATINAAGAYGTIVLARKSFRITAPLTLLAHSQIVGTSDEGSIIATSTDIVAFKIVGGEGQSIRNLTIACTATVRTTFDIDVTNPVKTVFEDLIFNPTSAVTGVGGGIYFHADTSVVGSSAFMPELTRVWIRHGHLVINGVTDGKFTTGFVWGRDSDARAAIDLVSAPGWTFTGVDVVPTLAGGCGYRIEYSKFTHIQGGYLDSGAALGSFGIYFVNTTQSTVIGTNFYGTGRSGIRLDSSNGNVFTALSFYNNNRENNAYPDIEMVGSSYNTFTGSSHVRPVVQSNAGLVYREDGASLNNLLDNGVLDPTLGNYYAPAVYTGNPGTIGQNNRPASLWPQPNVTARGTRGNTEDVGRKAYNFVAGTALPIATIDATAGNYSSFLLEIEMTARDPSAGNCYIVSKKYIRPENGVPAVVTIGTDSVAAATFAITARNTNGISLSITTTSVVYATVIVRAAAPGAAGAAQDRGVIVTML